MSSVDEDVRLARDLKRARRQVKGCITVLEDVRRHSAGDTKTRLSGMLDQLRTARYQLTEAYCEVQSRLRARLPAPKVVADA